MRTFRASSLQDNALPWKCWDDTEHTRTRDEVWGVTLVPSPIYASYAKDEDGFEQPVGEILYYEWSALLDPSDTPLPEWITETTPIEITNP
jgi:hypothetical protein